MGLVGGMGLAAANQGSRSESHDSPRAAVPLVGLVRSRLARLTQVYRSRFNREPHNAELSCPAESPALARRRAPSHPMVTPGESSLLASVAFCVFTNAI